MLVPEKYLFEQYANDKEKQAFLILNRIVLAKHRDILTPEEKKSLAKIVKICLLPEDIPLAMEKFAKQLLDDMKHCKNDIEHVSKFVAEAYRQLTEIHPFPNGNRRVAITVVNLLFFPFGYPSIVFRNAEDKTDENSPYNQAIKQIDEKPELLVKYIQQKIADAQQQEHSIKIGPKIHDRLVLLEHLSKIQEILADTCFPSEKLFILGFVKAGQVREIANLVQNNILPKDGKDFVNQLQGIIEELCQLPPHLSIAILQQFRQIPTMDTTSCSDREKQGILAHSGLVDSLLKQAIDRCTLPQVFASVGKHQEPNTLGQTKCAIQQLCKSTSGLFNDHHSLLKTAVERHLQGLSKDSRPEIVLQSIIQKNYNKALRCAAAGGSAELVNIIARYKDKLPIEINERAGKNNNNALHWAASRGHTNAAKALSQHGASTSIKNGAELTASECASAAQHHFLAQGLESTARYQAFRF